MLFLFFFRLLEVIELVLLQSNIRYVGQILLNSTEIGPPDGQGLLNQLVPGTPDCRALPLGDGLVGVDGQNCPFQMYTIGGTFNISQGGLYSVCSTSAAGYEPFQRADIVDSS